MKAGIRNTGIGAFEPLNQSDLVTVEGGEVGHDTNGSSLGPSFTYIVPPSMPLPILIAIPHAGRTYPASVLKAMRDAKLGQLRLEDRHVDAVGVEIAKATGAGLLIAHAPRAMLDLNRAHDDVDWGMVVGGTRKDEVAQKVCAGVNRRAKSGLGLVPRRLPGFGEIWRSHLEQGELDRRIDSIHRPYHEFLAQELERIRNIWGAALLLDLHSMPPLRKQAGQASAPRIVLGDRFGAACDASLVGRAMRVLDDFSCSSGHNRPYSGGYVLDRHASTRRGLHAMQIEVCRSAYLDEQLDKTSAGVKPMATMLSALVRELGAEVARLGGEDQFEQAAE
ncbi:MAG: N-formylglutamate amidohydrolase [Pseudomonadota bacterium]